MVGQHRSLFRVPILKAIDAAEVSGLARETTFGLSHGIDNTDLYYLWSRRAKNRLGTRLFRPPMSISEAKSATPHLLWHSKADKIVKTNFACSEHAQFRFCMFR